MKSGLAQYSTTILREAAPMAARERGVAVNYGAGAHSGYDGEYFDRTSGKNKWHKAGEGKGSSKKGRARLCCPYSSSLRLLR